MVLNNFVDENLFYPTGDVEISKEKMSLLFIGRLVHQKGVDILLEALQILTKSPLNYELAIGGSGKNEIDYRSLASRLGIQNRIKWLGDLNRTQVKEEIHKCTLLVLPSRHENNPVILLETISCRKPIVATKCGVSEEVVSQTNGMISKMENSSDLADKIASIANNIKNYSASLIRMEFMNNYSSKAGAQKLLSIYKDVIKEGL